MIIVPIGNKIYAGYVKGIDYVAVGSRMDIIKTLSEKVWN